MMENKYNGPYKDYIKSYLEYRMSLGKKSTTYKSHLKNFDLYTIFHPKEKMELEKEYIERWLIKKKEESQNTLAYRASVIKDFCIYLNMKGINAYIIDKRNYKNERTFIPYIYSDHEIKEILNTAKTLKANKNFPYRKEMYGLLIELLYCCGLRLSDALNIRCSDIDFNANIIVINKGKNNIDRNIPIHNKLKKRILSYINLFENINNESYIFFNFMTQKRLLVATAESNFRIIIKKTNLDKSKNYRLHDFRHTFAVHNLRDKFRQGEDIDSFLPILMTYMGHQHIRSTEYYLRFTTDMYPEFIKAYEEKFNNIIPEVGDIFDK